MIKIKITVEGYSNKIKDHIVLIEKKLYDIDDNDDVELMSELIMYVLDDLEHNYYERLEEIPHPIMNIYIFAGFKDKFRPVIHLDLIVLQRLLLFNLEFNFKPYVFL